MNKLISFCLLFTTYLGGKAQPEWGGCHHFRNLNHKAHVLTDAEKAMVDASILRSDTIDILAYDIYLDVTEELSHFIEGWTTISFSPLLEGVNSITLDLYSLEIDSIVNSSGALNFTYDGNVIIAEFGETLIPSENYNLTVYYHGNPHQDPSWGGFYMEQGYVYNLGIGISTIPPNFGKVWYPCFDTFVERATYDYHVTSANNHKAFCQGTLMEEQVLNGDTVLRHYSMDQKIPSYLSAIAVSNYESTEYIHTGFYGDIPITLSSKPSQQSGMQSSFTELGSAIDALEYWYGPYPWSRVGYILTTDGALEIPTNIAYPQSMLAASLSANGSLFTHELGHCWWGDMITLREHNDMWIKEGPAEYSAHLFVEWTEGHEAFIDEVKDNMHFVLTDAHVDDNGFHPLSPMPDPYIYGRHTYYKGAAVMHNMRGYMGDDLWRQAMTGVQNNYAYSSFTPEQFKDALESESGYDLDPFFDAWVFAPGFSIFTTDSTVTTAIDGGYLNTVYLHQKLRETPEFHQQVPLEVSFLDENWNLHDFSIIADGEFTTVEIETDFQPAATILNANHRLNQSGMDYTVSLYPDENFNQQLPYVDLRLIKNEVSDSAWVRIEHLWVQPEDHPGEGVWDLGDRHYWRVDGIFPESYDLEARIVYKGVNDYDLDYDLVNETEENLVLVYRNDPSELWEVYPDYTLVAGSLTSASGTIRVDKLIPGEYALAKGDESVDMQENTLTDTKFVIYPNPAQEQLNISGYNEQAQRIDLKIFDEQGKMVLNKQDHLPRGEYHLVWDISRLVRGFYSLLMLDEKGNPLDQTSFQVMR